MTEEEFEQRVARVVAEAPPLTPEQAERIAALLRPQTKAATTAAAA